jgi:hypothetical protein
VTIYNFKNERVSDESFAVLDEVASHYGVHAVVGWFDSDIIEAYAELGETIDPESDFVRTWFYDYGAQIQEAMRIIGRAKILALAWGDVQSDSINQALGGQHVPD